MHASSQQTNKHRDAVLEYQRGSEDVYVRWGGGDISVYEDWLLS